MYLFYDNNGSPFSKPVISLDSVCEVLKGGAVFYRHDLGRERYGKGAFTRRMLDGDRYESARPARGFAYEERCMDCRQGVPQGDRKEATSLADFFHLGLSLVPIKKGQPCGCRFIQSHGR